LVPNDRVKPQGHHAYRGFKLAQRCLQADQQKSMRTFEYAKRPAALSTTSSSYIYLYRGLTLLGKLNFMFMFWDLLRSPFTRKRTGSLKRKAVAAKVELIDQVGLMLLNEFCQDQPN